MGHWQTSLLWPVEACSTAMRGSVVRHRQTSRLPMEFCVWELFLFAAYYQTNRARTEQEREKDSGRGDEQRLFEPRLCFVSFRSSILHLPHFAAVHWPKREKRGWDWPTRAGSGGRSPQAKKKNAS